jgi:putative oxidoreductase
MRASNDSSTSPGKARISETFQSWSPRLHGVLRIVTGFLRPAWNGCCRTPHVAMFDNIETGSPMWFAGILEIVGGPLILIGLCTRPVAFLLSGMMAIAYFKMHFPGGPMPLLNQGELAVMYCFVFLFFAAAGGGAWSVDAMRSRTSS